MSRMTVASALALPQLRRGLPEVVAGANSIDREIRWVHAGEVPEMASLLQGGELLLTTGMGIDTLESQRRFVVELAARGVAGLVIELGGTFTSRLPRQLVEAAASHGLPLVELHSTVRFVTVTEAIHTEIVNDDYELLRRAELLRREFTRRMLDGAGVPGVLSLLAQTLGNPVFLETSDGRLLAHAAASEDVADDPVAAWADARAEADSIGASAPVTTDGDAEGRRLLALPVVAPLDRFAPIAIARAAELVALALLRERQENELLSLTRGDLLAKIADGRIQPRVAAGRAREMGFAGSRTEAFLPLAARLVAPAAPEIDGEPRAAGSLAVASWVGTLRELEREIAAVGAPVMIGVHPVSGDLLMLVGLRRGAERAAIADRTAAVLHAAAGRGASAEPVVAVGPAGGWGEIGGGLSDAIESAGAAANLPRLQWHDATSMPLECLLWSLGDNANVARYVERLLDPLVAHDRSRKHALTPTLETLCANGGHKSATARELRLNRQGLYGRIERLEAVLGVDLADPASLFALDLALRARRHLRINDRGAKGRIR